MVHWSYPEFLDRIEDNELLWKDGTRMRVDDGKGPKPLDAMLDDPDVKDMFLMRYPLGEKGVPPEPNFDPGRVRYLPLFNKMYGDCRSAGFMTNATNVLWLPSRYGKNLQFTRVNGAAEELQKVSNELDRLPAHFLDYLRPTQGTYNCRASAGTSHGVRTASASRSILRPRILTTRYGRSLTPTAGIGTKMGFPGRS